MLTSSSCSKDALILPQRRIAHLQGEFAGCGHSCSRTYIPRPPMLTVRVTEQVRLQILRNSHMGIAVMHDNCLNIAELLCDWHLQPQCWFAPIDQTHAFGS